MQWTTHLSKQVCTQNEVNNTPVRTRWGERHTPAPIGLVFKAHRLLYHSTLGLRVIKKRRRPAPSAPRRAHRSRSAAAPLGEQHIYADRINVLHTLHPEVWPKPQSCKTWTPHPKRQTVQTPRRNRPTSWAGVDPDTPPPPPTAHTCVLFTPSRPHGCVVRFILCAYVCCSLYGVRINVLFTCTQRPAKGASITISSRASVFAVCGPHIVNYTPMQ